MNRQHLILLSIIFLFLFLTSHSQENEDLNSAIRPTDFKAKAWNEAKLHRADPQWLKEARFGIWCHWGISSLPGLDNKAYGWYGKHMYRKTREEYQYHLKKYGHDVHFHDLINKFTGEKFNAKEWVDLYEQGGAKMVGIMGEHHDGFSLWDSDINPWNATKMGPKRDIVGEIAKEVRKRKLRLEITLHHGFHELFFPRAESFSPRYKSKWEINKDWHPPLDKKYNLLYSSYLTEEQADKYWKDKMIEVMNKYAPDYIYTDFGPRFIEQETRIETVTKVFNMATENKQDFVFNSKAETFPTEFAIKNVEQSVLGDISDQAWYVDFTVNPGWFYAGEDKLSHEADFYERVLVDVVSKNGFLALSYGPRPDGSIPEKHARVIKSIGKWLKVVGEGIYNTLPFYTFGEGNTDVGGEIKDFNEHGVAKKALNKLGENTFRFTRRGNIIYLFNLKYNTPNKQYLIESFGGELSDYFKVKSLSLLGSDEKINWTQDHKGLHISSPKKAPKSGNKHPYAYKITLDDNFIYQAESAKINKLSVVNLKDANQSKAVLGLEKNNSTLSFDVNVSTAGQYRMVVKYQNQGASLKGHNRFLNISINDGAEKLDYCFHASEEKVWQTSFVKINLEKGKNTIVFKNSQFNKLSAVRKFYLDDITLLPLK